MQARFWRLLIQLKADSVYVTQYVIRSDRIDNRINVFSAIAASGSVATWAVWQKYDWIWAAITAVSQVITATKHLLPFKKRVAPLRSVSYAYEDIFLRAEQKWYDISEGRTPESEINALLFQFKSEQAKTWRKYLSDVSIPTSKSVKRIADDITAAYFRQTYNVKVTITNEQRTKARDTETIARVNAAD